MAPTNVDISLLNFSNALIPSDDFIKEGKALVEKVFEVLKTKSRFPIARVFYGGSIGKNTSVICPDFDCTLFINQEEPPFSEVIDDFENILILNESFLKIEEIKANQYSVQCTFESGYTLDLLPAANFVQNQLLSGYELAEVQRKEVIRRIEKNPTGLYSIYSSSLVESQLQFMKLQGSYTHQLVRIVKFWYKTLFFGGEYIAGGKTIMELIAVAAADGESDIMRQSLFRGFMTFLDMLRKFDSLKLAFTKVGNDKWKLMERRDLMHLILRPYFLIEPANPHNDMAARLSTTIINKFKEFAAITKKRFSDATRDPARMIVMIGGQPFLSLDELFRPLPTVLLSDPLFSSIPKQPFYLLDVIYDCKLKNPDKKIRNDNLLNKREFKIFLNGVQTFLFANVHAAFLSGHPIGPEVQQAVGKMIYNDVRGQAGEAECPWSPTGSGDRHEDYDVTFTVPFGNSSTAIVLSMKW